MTSRQLKQLSCHRKEMRPTWRCNCGLWRSTRTAYHTARSQAPPVAQVCPAIEEPLTCSTSAEGPPQQCTSLSAHQQAKPAASPAEQHAHLLTNISSAPTRNVSTSSKRSTNTRHSPQPHLAGGAPPHAGFPHPRSTQTPPSPAGLVHLQGSMGVSGAEGDTRHC